MEIPETVEQEAQFTEEDLLFSQQLKVKLMFSVRVLRYQAKISSLNTTIIGIQLQTYALLHPQ